MNEQQVKNLGFNLELEEQHAEDSDWFLGADTPKSMCEEAVGLVSASFAWARPDKNGIYQKVNARINHCWCFFQENLKKYFPIGQLQNLGGEKFNCVVNGFNNEIEKQLNYCYDKGFLSDGFINFLKKYNFFHEGKIRLNNRIPAKGSGTTRGGNSLKAVVQWIHEYGIFPQSSDPEDVAMDFDEYYSKELTEEVLAIGQESKKYLTINYAKVTGIKNFLKYAGNFMWKIFDNYKDAFDGDFIKQLAENYKILNYGYKLILNETGFTPVEPSKKKDMINIIQFQSQKKVYLQSNTNPKRLYWIGNENTFNLFKEEGWIGDWVDIQELQISLKVSYEIKAGMIIISYAINSIINVLNSFGLGKIK